MSQWCEPGTAAVTYADLIYHRVRDGMLINERLLLFSWVRFLVVVGVCRVRRSGA